MEAIAKLVSPYFTSQYDDNPVTIKRNNIIVYRPNHGLVFGMGQAYICKIVIEKYQFYRIEPQDLKLKTILENTLYFVDKFCLLAACQRIGRGSEISSAADLQTYEKYIHRDVAIYQKLATLSGWFQSVKEIKESSEYLFWPLCKGDYQLSFIECILKTVHFLLLRRIFSFDKVRICTSIQQTSGFSPAQVLELWDITGIYLKETGDRDMERSDTYGNVFFKLSNNPCALASLVNNL